MTPQEFVKYQKDRFNINYAQANNVNYTQKEQVYFSDRPLARISVANAVTQSQ
ncbi:hypothetical protein [Mannheimia massilioguelmaensis]|uniref:hypothetical protein n=1 Tax=Mannheimia massilioguelmaensis TaxID=1604354 RepID=UPI0012E03559|nr:hypothetical protein [Mannheimia massilioguelmaensis]